MFVLAMIGFEGVVRLAGAGTSMSDGPDRWASVRSDVYAPGRVVVIGGSRAQFGISPEVFARAREGFSVRQLSVGGSWNAAVLRDLAADTGFSGHVIASMRPEGMEPSHWPTQQSYVDHYHEAWNPDRRLSLALRDALEQRLAAMNRLVAPLRLAQVRVDGGELPTFWARFRRDRSIDADFSRHDTPDDETRWIVQSMLYDEYEISRPARWLEDTRPIEAWVRRIQARGGRVALVRFPTSGVSWKIDQRHYPRAAYWDAFAARSQAITIHFADEPSLTGYDLPDGTHLDKRDTARFTRNLVDVLSRRGFFEAAREAEAASPSGPKAARGADAR